MKKLIKRLLRENLLDEEDYFNLKLPKDVKRLSKRYEGRNVVWYGDPAQMIVLSADQVHGMWGNIYYPEKMEYLVDLITNSEEKVELECSYGIGGITTLTDIIEEQSAVKDGRFEVDYENLKEPSTTGDQELDDYVGTEDLSDLDFISYGVGNEDILKLMYKYRFFLAKNTASLDTVINLFNQLEPDNGEVEAFNEFIRLESELKHAQDTEDGDFGKFTVQLRDGHHRVMGAIEAGERKVCVNLDKDDIIRYKGYYDKV